MFDTLLGFFPDAPAAVLDVGCGLGVAAHKMAALGFEVTAIAPSQALIDFARREYGTSGARFEVADFMENGQAEFEKRTYDVILFQESLQYLRPLGSVFAKVRDLLGEGGRVIIADEVRYDPALSGDTAVHDRRSMVLALLENGFRETVRRKIGEQVKPTCRWIVEQFTSRFSEIVARMPGSAETVSAALTHFLEGWKQQQRWYRETRMGYELIVARRDSVFCRAYQPGDEADILPLFNEIFGTQRTPAHWNWKFKQNPYGRLRIALARSVEGELAAQYCGYPIPFHLSDGTAESLMAHHIGDTMTHPDFRRSGRGPTSVLNRTTRYFYERYCRDRIRFNYGFNTANIRKFGERFLGYVYTSHVPYYVLAPVPPPKRSLAGILASVFKGVRVDKVLTTGPEFDRFFERASRHYALLVKRDSGYLKWRYLDCPDRVHSLFGVRRRGRLVGWGVFALRETDLVWGDALFERTDAYLVKILLEEVLRRYYPGARRVVGWFSPTPQWWGRALTGVGFEVGLEPNRLAPGFKIFDPRFDTGFLEENFYYAMGDSDLF